MVGYCTHFLPIRSRLSDNPTAAEYLASLRETVLAAYKHQDYPFAWLMGALGLDGELGAFPLTSIFNLDRSYPPPALCELQAEFSPVPAQFALVDLRLDAIEIDGEIWLDCDYRTNLFDAETVSRWCADYRTLLEEIARDPRQRVADLPVASVSV